ncbi:MAG: MATE family efflux transporter [Clostridiaceae bacterium]|nr:MATE family efflux transporter [Clostridiaceae bacterium]
MFNMQVDLLNGSIMKSLVLFAIPLFISNVFQQLYNTVDTMIVGNCLGDTSLAAIGACAAVYDLLIGFALGIGNGLSIVCARCFGEKNEERLKKSVAGSIIIGIVVSVIITIIAKITLYPLLQLLNTPEDIINEAYSYISFITLFVIVMFGYNLCAGLLRAIGNSIVPLIFLIISSILNIGLDIIFITNVHMGIAGAAVATVVSQSISIILCVIYIIKRCPNILPKKEHFNVDKELFRELLGQGLSMGFMMSIVSSGTVILQSSINGLGYLIIAGHTAARKIQAFFMMAVIAVGVSLSTFVSQNKGANQGERIRKAVRYCNIYAIVSSAVIFIIIYFAAPSLINLISGSSEVDVLNNGTRYLRINALFYPVLGILLNLRNSLQGIGKKIVPLISSCIECIGKIVFVLLFIPTLKYFGVIICEPVIWCLMTIQLVYSFYNNEYIKSYSKKAVLQENFCK